MMPVRRGSETQTSPLSVQTAIPASTHIHNFPAETMEDALDELQRIREELVLARQGLHPDLADFDEESVVVADADLEEEEESYEMSKRRLKELCERRLRNYEADLHNKMRTAKDDLIKDIEASERIADLEYNTSEIGKINYVNHENGKKTLRGRGGGDLIVPPSYLNANPKPATPCLTQSTQFLLTDTEIAADLRAFSNTKVEPIERTSKTPNIRNKVLDVQLSRQRLIYDSKPFKQGDEVQVENMEYGKFQARIDQITDTVVIFKATLGWDTRQIHASCSDLQELRVTIYKKRNN